MNINEKNVLNERVRAILADVFQVPQDEVTQQLAFGDLLQWDSLGHMDVMMRLEEEFGVEINTDTIAELVSVPAICEYIRVTNQEG